MKHWEHFDYDEHDGIATLTFSRPDRLNSLTFEVYADVRDLTDSLRRRHDVKVLVIRGRGRGFCSGGDVDEIIAELLHRGTRDIFEFAHMTGACVRNLREMPQPVIAAVNGVAAGAGAVLAAASDIRILAESASFRFLFTSVGLSGGDMGMAPWGLAMTKEMVNRAASTDYASAIEMEAFTQTLLMTAEDFREFHAGFTGKRKPRYTGH